MSVLFWKCPFSFHRTEILVLLSFAVTISKSPSQSKSPSATSTGSVSVVYVLDVEADTKFAAVVESNIIRTNEIALARPSLLILFKSIVITHISEINYHFNSFGKVCFRKNEKWLAVSRFFHLSIYP